MRLKKIRWPSSAECVAFTLGREALFWLPLIGGFALAWPLALLVKRALIRRERGHSVVHEYHH